MADSSEIKGDVFWDLPPWISYIAGTDLGFALYVANPTDTVKEYALISNLSQSGTVISEESIKVFGYAWFKVEAGDWVRLRGSLRLEDTNCLLTVVLVEKDTEEVLDSVATYLQMPSAAALPPGWPVSGTPVQTTDWMGMMLPFMMLGLVGAMVTSMVRAPEERKQLSEGRR
jgi:phosphotransferase system  glucose/maltose/N-acetylglucosamine-specific IIC component